MVRRDDDMFDMLTDLPWWIGVITAGVLYALLRYLAPGLAGDDAIAAPLAEVSRMFALPVAGLALLASGFSALRSLFARMRGGAHGSVVQSSSRTCPHCGSTLVLRRASRGTRAGSSFWGCSNYPKCRYTENVTA